MVPTRLPPPRPPAPAAPRRNRRQRPASRRGAANARQRRRRCRPIVSSWLILPVDGFCRECPDPYATIAGQPPPAYRRRAVSALEFHQRLADERGPHTDPSPRPPCRLHFPTPAVL